MKIVIVGGVAGGASAAARLRRLDEKAEIIIEGSDEFCEMISRTAEIAREMRAAEDEE